MAGDYKDDKYEWGLAKAESNFKDHGVEFEEVKGFDWDTCIWNLDTREDYDEDRCWAIGYIGNNLHYLAYTERGTRTRVISLRRATKREIQLYER